MTLIRTDLPQEMSEFSGFVEYLGALGLATRTVRAYAGRIVAADAWFSENGKDLSRARIGDLLEFAETIPYTASSRRLARNALRHYFVWIERPEVPLTMIRVPKTPRYLCRALEPSEASRLVAVARGRHPQGTAVLAGLYLALRAHEIAAMRFDRFDASLTWYRVIGKGGTDATLPVHSVLRDQIEANQSAYLFLFPGSRQRAHVTATTIGLWTAELSELAGIGRIQTHRLRHTSLATLNDKTGDLRAVQTFARHSRPETTALYTRTTTDRLRELVEEFDY